MRQFVFIFAAAVLATACSPVTSNPAAPSGPEQSQSAAACQSRGGELRRVGRMQSEQCVIGYADADKACTSSDQCAGDCRIEAAPFPDAGSVAQGRCQAESQNFGCHANVENGRATAAICID
jgi:hypothetical protein